MCNICVTIATVKRANGGDFLTESQVKSFLNVIASKMSDPAQDHEHLQEIIDMILDTNMPPRDLAVEEAWQKANTKLED